MKEEGKEKSWGDIVEEEEEQKAAKEVTSKLASTKIEDKLSDEFFDVLTPDDHLREFEVQQADPSNPLHSVKSFEDLGLSQDLKDGVYDMGFDRPSKIQETALPMLLGYKGKAQNLIAQSQSGTGKTAAFVLTMLSHSRADIKKPQALCLAPTRELAKQIAKVVVAMGQFTGLRILELIKDVSLEPGAISHQVVVGTPGTVYNSMRANRLQVDQLHVFVLDEADNMLAGQGIRPTTLKIKQMILKQSKHCQFALFSATFSGETRKFAEQFVPKPFGSIILKTEELTLDGIKQIFIETDKISGSDSSDPGNRFMVLKELYSSITVGQSIIFTRTVKTCEDLYSRLTALKFSVGVIHGGKSPDERDNVMSEFRKGKLKVLISANVLARGVDIPAVTLVINYDLPTTARPDEADPSTYLHRIGRTGRFGKMGIALNMLFDGTSRKLMGDIAGFFKSKIQRLPAEDMKNTLNKLLEDTDKENQKILSYLANIKAKKMANAKKLESKGASEKKPEDGEGEPKGKAEEK